MVEHPYGWLSILPPIVAIVLAIVTHRVVVSLIAGVFVGALVTTHGHVVQAVIDTCERHLWTTLTQPGNLRVYSFTLLMGAMIGVITASGGMRGLIDSISPWASTRRRGQLMTWLLGMIIFFDDYANTILLGSTLRPICDRLRISREKLAYLVDSTAAPVAGLALISTWVAGEILYVQNGLEGLPDPTEYNAFELFVASIPYRFYILTALVLVPLVGIMGRDFRAMYQAEEDCLRGNDATRNESAAIKELDATARTSPWYNAIVPIVVTLSVVVVLIYQTGRASLSPDESNLNQYGIVASGPDQFIVPGSTSLEVVSRVLGLPLGVSDDDTLSGLLRARKGGDLDAGDRLALEEASVEVREVEGSRALRVQVTLEPSLRAIFGNANSTLSLQYGALVGLLLAAFMARVQGLLAGFQVLQAAGAGTRVVLPAIAILWCASTVSRLTGNTAYDGTPTTAAYEFQDHRLYTGDFLKEVLAEQATAEGASERMVRVLPTVVFVLSAIVAFCTGTSWGTMGILVPMVVTLSHSLLSQGGATVAPSDPIFLCCIGGVLAGSVFGDHCSPLSDTTILSSQASGCDHIAHVWTQMPYAISVAIVSVGLGTLPLGYGVSVWVLLPLQFIAIGIILRFFGRKVEIT